MYNVHAWMYHSGTYLEGELEEKGENKGKCPSHYICKSDICVPIFVGDVTGFVYSFQQQG